ncbi:hypothetical protein GT348_03015 [Aristophania vespae]|uniref:Uncharacterized protein n=1 Tax=Aristophania vespae TaxID=2697033 RepID=A0A6P1NAD4_9PROT|nr:hypothetical protein [Aristophania vespae]QHI95376.1 hypothetical protein GT348_03015 [Aristophania vespae]
MSLTIFICWVLWGISRLRLAPAHRPILYFLARIPPKIANLGLYICPITSLSIIVVNKDLNALFLWFFAWPVVTIILTLINAYLLVWTKPKEPL